MLDGAGGETRERVGVAGALGCPRLLTISGAVADSEPRRTCHSPVTRGDEGLNLWICLKIGL
jgi:hypothetical protein